MDGPSYCRRRRQHTGGRRLHTGDGDVGGSRENPRVADVGSTPPAHVGCSLRRAPLRRPRLIGHLCHRREVRTDPRGGRHEGQEGLDAIRDVIYFIETYDVTTVRASTPMYLLARVIKSMGIKMVLSGEGADEIFGGYLYFHKAPSPEEFHKETVRKLSKLYLYDCLRANKSLAAWGVEGRVPFLDKEFLDVAMSLDPKFKMCPGQTIEKKVVREAFSDMLPAEVAWRQKEQFSDGVGYSWIDTLKEITASAVSDEQMAHAAERFPINPPRNKEEYYYRSIFAEHFPSDSAARSVPSVPSIACSTAEALAWDKAWAGQNEPSGRAVRDVHHNA